MRRGQSSEKKTRLVKKVETEFELFKYRTLSKSRKKIFESCNEIRFYSCVYEYFIYADGIQAAHIDACLKCEEPIAELHRLYLKYEYLQCGRWENIEELLSALTREQEDRCGQKSFES